MSQDFKHHAHVGPVHSGNLEVVQKHHWEILARFLDISKYEIETCSFPEGVVLISLSHTFQQLDLVQGSFCMAQIEIIFHQYSGLQNLCSEKRS